MTYEKTLAVLANPTRRAVFERLRQGPSSVAGLAENLPVSRPAVSQHLKALKAADLVRDEPRGTARIYRIHAPGLKDLRDWLDGFWDEALTSFRDFAEEEIDDRCRDKTDRENRRHQALGARRIPTVHG